MAPFPRHKRLLVAQDFARVFQARKKIVSSRFVVYFGVNNKGFARLGLAIGKKNLPKSVDRNRVKRIIRETFRHVQTLGGYDVVVVNRRGLHDLSKHDLREELINSWQRLTGSQVLQKNRCTHEQ